MEILSIFLLNIALSSLLFYMYNRFSKKRRIYCNDDVWMPIDTLPEDEYELFLTDGEYVRNVYYPDYNKKGQCVFGYDHKVATHWRRLPLPPQTHFIPIERPNDALRTKK
jgi:hypothetical protein